ncbi:MAG: rhomboid family intramembrane serine protease [Actinomycetota bacterium]|nr:rhomboid family intramembrane serine protease [Actinomycetota bacterium]
MTPPDGGAPSTAEAAAQRAHCYRHPNREAGVRCTRCDRPICPECMRPASVGFHCPDDVNIARKSVRAPRTSVGARLMQSPPYVTFALIAANVVIYLITVAQSGKGFTGPLGVPLHRLFDNWQLQPLAVKQRSEYYRLLTSAFLHVSVLHIGSNMLALFFIGPPLERLLGRWRFSAVYLLGALGGSAAVYAWGDINVPEVGASGAIFGLFAACLVFVRKLGLDLQWLVGIIVINFVLTFSIQNISRLGHLGGFVAGGLAALAIGGMPHLRQRLSVQSQLLGLGGVAAAIAAIVIVRTATF